MQTLPSGCLKCESDYISLYLSELNKKYFCL